MNYNTDQQKLDDLHKVLLKYWEDVAEDASEGHEELGLLNNALSKITMNPHFEANTTPALKKLLGSVGEFETSRESSEALNKVLFETASLIQWYPNNVTKML